MASSQPQQQQQLQQQQQQQQSGLPYSLPMAQMGGLPLVVPDIPISATLLFFFTLLAATHMAIFQINRRREHNFVFSALLFALSMARIATLTMRIVWATQPTNVQIAISAAILTQAGVIIVFVVNLFFTERIILAYHSRLRQYLFVKLALRILVALIITMIIMAIIATVHSMYTLSQTAKRKDRDVQLFAATFLAVLAFLPIPILIISALVPSSNEKEKFGTGQLRTKVFLLLFTASLLTLGAGFRIGSNYAAPLINDPQWFDHKAVFYTVTFGIELIISFTYAVARFDKRFHVPDKTKGASTGQETTADEIESGAFNTVVQTETASVGLGQSEPDSAVKVDKENSRALDVEKGRSV
ncbi:uncharacterized protein BCR38DRAFT_487752 [Pseudomassariella vexata]|uniref:Uncharacterized protein n=1 Tax=Pseudomassariella vexata TaxID=1141098 RepID=A0A1Y2DN32_9PEZI|nr:uncharacterized protein BCR38DRAFT_487752 [Pseudomassariella vexata]ORY60682.1 hypothetical protein BCR38DRAFT_487752 [Pseudomassariella vexata]